MAVLTNSLDTFTLDTLPPVASVLAAAKAAQRHWRRVPVRQRLEVIRRFRELTAAGATALADTVDRPLEETLTSEVLPLLEACRYLERNAEQLLSPKRQGRFAPFWMRSIGLTTYREPFGAILIIGPGNYPIFLTSVQAAQALVAGNAVIIKPGLRGSAAALLVVQWLREAGLPEELAGILDESPEAAMEAIRAGVDKIVVTGSKQTGKAVLTQAAATITPVVAELSGWDPVFLLQDADLQLAASALAFGVNLNSGDTCIRPRVLYGKCEMLSHLQGALGSLSTQFEFVAVANEQEAIDRAAGSEYALGGTVFGSPARAKAVAEQLRAGVVVINDMIAPTAHPEISFGGRGWSGFGVTRGPEGLLEMTATKTIAVQRSGWRPHFQPPRRGDAKLFSAFARMLHGATFSDRLRAAGELWRAARNRSKET